MTKKPTLVALSSLMAMSVPIVSSKLSTSEMRKNLIRANAVELDADNDSEKDIPETDSSKSDVSDADLITVELSQDGVSTVMKKSEENKEIKENKNELVPEPKLSGASKLDITKVELLTVRSSDLKFKLNSTILEEQAIPVLEDIKNYVESNDYDVTIVGYTDSSGIRSYNEKLSLKRAESVTSKLIELGLSPTRIVEILGKGDANPIASNDTEEGRITNRRVEFMLIKRGMKLF